ncbi:MAG: hypothetical protein IJQ50_06695 [Clostridia bacterium]|nr:hypothetical protein [Clostridia bacterium]
MNLKTDIKRKKTTYAIAAFVIIFVVVLVIFFSSIFSNHTIKNIFTAESGKNYKMVNYNKNIAVVDYDGANVIDSSGEIKYKIEYHMGTPRMDISDKYMLLYDKGGRSYSLYKNGEEIYKNTSDMTINFAKTNKNGYVILTTDETGYNSRVSVISPAGKTEYIWKIGDGYLVDIDISPNNKNIAAAIITTDSGLINENIVFVNTDKEIETNRVSSEGSMPISIDYSDSGMVTVVSDNRLCGYSSAGELKWTVSYESKLLNMFDVDKSGNVVLALSGIKNNTIIETYTKNGRKSGEYTTDSAITSINVNGKYIIFTEKNKASVMNYYGKVLNSHEFTREYKDSVILDKNEIVLLRNDGIDLLKM